MKSKILYFILLALLLFFVVFVKNTNIFFRILEAAIIIYAAYYVSQQTEGSVDSLAEHGQQGAAPDNVLSMISLNVKDFFHKFIVHYDVDRLLFVTVADGEKFNIDYDFGFSENDEFVFEKKVILKAFREDVSIHFSDIEGYKTVICNTIKDEAGKIIAVVFIGNIKKYLIIDTGELERFLNGARRIARAIINRYELEAEFKKKMLSNYMEGKQIQGVSVQPSKSGKEFFVADLFPTAENSLFLFYSIFPEPENIATVIEDIGFLRKSLEAGGTIVRLRELLKKSESPLVIRSFFAQILLDTKLLSFQLSGDVYLYRKNRNMLKFALERRSGGETAKNENLDVLDQLQLVSGDSLLITARELSEKELVEPFVDSTLNYLLVEIR